MRKLSPSLVVTILVTSLAVSASGQEQSAQELEQQIRQLVEQLDSDSYAQREAAASQLTRLGDDAVAALEAALKSPQAETRLRVERILAEIRQDDLERRIDAFLASSDPASGENLPLWPRFRDLAGDGSQQRQWYVRMLRSEGDLLSAAATNPRAAAGTFQLRCQELQQVSSSQARELHDANLAAILLVAGDDRLPIAAGTESMLYRFCSHSAVKAELEQAENESIMRKIVGSWIASGRGGYYALRLAMQHEMPEGLVAAETMLDGKTADYYRQYAILTFAKLGDKSHIPRLMKLLGDANVCTTHQVNNEKYQTQFRDIALVAVLHLAGYDPQTFGFERIRPHSEYVYSPYTLGFKDEKDREAAFARWEKVKPKVAPEPEDE